MTVNILGTEYRIDFLDYDSDPKFKESDICGYCSYWDKRIVICNVLTLPSFKGENPDILQVMKKESIRHEIAHAFLFESGLESSAHSCNASWTENEEMVDWIALQGPKLIKVWQDADAL